MARIRVAANLGCAAHGGPQTREPIGSNRTVALHSFVTRDDNADVGDLGTTEAVDAEPSTRRGLIAAGTAFALVAACNKRRDPDSAAGGPPTGLPRDLPFAQGPVLTKPTLQPRSDGAYGGIDDDGVRAEKTTSATPAATPTPMATPTPRRTVTAMAGPTATTAATATPIATATPSASATATPTPTPSPTPVPTPAPSKDLLLQRLTFGPEAAMVAELEEMGPAAWLSAQLNPSSIDDSAVDGWLTGYTTLTSTNAQNWALLQVDGGEKQVIGELMHHALIRAVFSRRQVYEMLCDFWHNHLNVHLFANWSYRHLATEYDRAVIRPHALGRFADLLQASAKAPAMLVYLDNTRSNANSSAGVNENYGRELLELHTLGIIDGGQVYSEVDVRNCALVLSGWRVDEAADADVFQFRQSWHWRGAVSILGGAWSRPDRTGASDATLLADGESLLDFLAHHPRTAQYLATKLARRFVSDTPPAGLVNQLASVYLANDTAIAPVMAALVDSDEFALSAGAKVRRGFETVTSYLRATDAAVAIDPVGPAAEALHSLSWYEGVLERHGQRLFSWPTPDGYPDTSAEWLSSDAMLRRWETAGLLAHNELADGIVVDLPALLPTPLPSTMGQMLDAYVERLTGSAAAPGEITALAAFIGVDAADPASTTPFDDPNLLADCTALILARPSFQYR